MDSKTLCGLVASIALSGACQPSDYGRELNSNVKIPAACRKILNFGYNQAVSRYFVSCQKGDEHFSFYAREPGTEAWSETKFGTGELSIPRPCGNISNLGYNYAASRYFLACHTDDGGSFFTKKPGSGDWKEVRFVSEGARRGI